MGVSIGIGSRVWAKGKTLSVIISKLFRYRWLWALGALSLMVFIYWASDRAWDSGENGLRLPGGSANLIHFVLYGLLTAHWGLAFGAATASEEVRDQSLFSPALSRMWGPAVLISCAFGLVDEWHQDSVPGRSCSLFDVVENFLGGVFGASALGWWLSSVGWTRPRVRILAILAILGAVVGLFAAKMFPELDALISRRSQV